MALFVRPRPPAFLKESLAKNLLSRLGPLADARAVWVMDARSRVSAERKYSTSRPCGTQEGGLPGVHPPALAAGKRAACPARPRAGLSCAVTHPALKRGVGGTLPPVRGSRGQSPPLEGMEGGTAPSRGERGRPPPQRVPRTDNSSPPPGEWTCVPFPHARVFRPSESIQPPALAVRKKGACPGCNPPALAAGKKAACPARPRAGLSRAATHLATGRKL